MRSRDTTFNNPDWTTEQLLIECGALNLPAAKRSFLRELLTRVLHPLARRDKEQEDLAEKVSFALRRDGFEVRQTAVESAYPITGSFACGQVCRER